MTEPWLEIPNVSGRTVERIVLHDDPYASRDVTIRFTDHTEMSILLVCKQIAEVRHFGVNTDQTFFESDEATP